MGKCRGYLYQNKVRNNPKQKATGVFCESAC